MLVNQASFSTTHANLHNHRAVTQISQLLYILYALSQIICPFHHGTVHGSTNNTSKAMANSITSFDTYGIIYRSLP